MTSIADKAPTLTKKELADELSVSPSTLARWLNQENLVYLQVNINYRRHQKLFTPLQAQFLREMLGL